MLTLMLTIFSCQKIDEWTQFNMEYTSSVSIPATLGIDLPIDIWTPNIPSNSEEEFESNNTAKNLIEKIVLTKLSMEITSPENSSFDFLKNIEIYIEADGLEEKKIAWLEDIPKTGLKKIELETSADDLKDFIMKDNYKLRTKTVSRQLISHETEVEIKNTFFVDAKILGI
jgi:hypothetical protein